MAEVRTRWPRIAAVIVLAIAAALGWVAYDRANGTPGDLLTDLVEQTGVAGGVAAWGVPGGPANLASAGFADRAAGRAMTPADRLPVASLTKPVVAALVLDRVDEGAIALDTPLAELDPGAPAEVTVGQALAHLGGWDWRVSGDPYFVPLAQLAAETGGTPPATCRDLAVLPGSAPSLPAGREHVYSNIGYCWLGQVFAAQGGFAAALEAAHGPAFSLDPATATVVPDPLDPAAMTWAVMQPGIAGPFGGLVTDAESYLAFALGPADDRTLSPPPGSWETNYYGLGWRVWPRGDTVYLTHYGSMPGVFSFVIRRIDGGAAVLILNGTIVNHQGLAGALAEQLMRMPAWQ